MNTKSIQPAEAGALLDYQHDGQSLIFLSGHWVIDGSVPSVDAMIELIGQQPTREIGFECSALLQWDSRLLIYLLKIRQYCQANTIDLVTERLPDGVCNLLRLADAVPEQGDINLLNQGESLLAKIGLQAMVVKAELDTVFDFIGELCLSFARLLRGRAHYRHSDVWLMVDNNGPQALPLVTLISLLVGLVLAFVGAVQLEMFGAQIYVANLVALGMTREMGAMMAAIIMAGRTGAAFAAQLGSMQANEEIDALRTTGLSPIDFLVMPRMVALVLMMPLLALYSNLMGIIGGAMVGVMMLDIAPFEYYHQTAASVSMTDLLGGLFKSVIFGVLVATAGCMRGIHCGRSSTDVGNAATAAVVTGIVWIVISDAILTVLYDALGI